MKCRLEEEMEEGECKMTWYLDDKVIEANDRSPNLLRIFKNVFCLSSVEGGLYMFEVF